MLNKQIDIQDVQGWIARLLVLMIFFAQPLYFNSARYSGLTYHKFVFFVVYMCIILVFILIVWLYRLTRKPRLIPRGRFSVTDWAILGFAAVMLISALLSPYKSFEVVWWNVWLGMESRYDGAITQLLYVAVYFIVSRWYRLREKDFILFAASAILVALIGIFQFYGMDFFGLWETHPYKRGYSADNYFGIWVRTTIGNVNFVSTYVCVAVLLCGFLFVRRDYKWRYVWLAGGAFSFWMMIIAGSYSGMVGTLAAMVLALPFIIQNKKYLGRFLILASSLTAIFTVQRLLYNTLILGAGTASGLIILAALMCALLAAGIALNKAGKTHESDGSVKWKMGVILIGVCLVFGLAGVEILGRSENAGPVYQAREILRGNAQDDFGSHRIHIWRNVLRAFPQHLLLGGGPDSLIFVYPTDQQMVIGGLVDKAHNEYLQILICQGILGLLCYLIFIGGVFFKGIKKAVQYPIHMAVLAAFTGYCVQAFFNISLPIIGQLLWVFAGLLASRPPPLTASENATLSENTPLLENILTG